MSDKIMLNFRCPTEVLEAIDALGKKRYQCLISPCNPHPSGLHPELIVFFDLKSQKMDCNLPS